MNQQEAIKALRDALEGVLNKRGYGCGDGSDHQVEAHNESANKTAIEALAATVSIAQAARAQPDRVALSDAEILQIIEYDERLYGYVRTNLIAFALAILAAQASAQSTDTENVSKNAGKSTRHHCSPMPEFRHRPSLNP